MGYRKVWEKHYGFIPKDEQGRTYEIHHIDGNRKNNDINNLQCLSIQEHYDLHLLQGDYAAAFRIGQRMLISTEEKSRLMSLSNQKRLSEGIHPFIDSVVREKAAKTIQQQINEGTYHFLKENRDPKWQEKANKSYAEKHNRSKVVKEGWDHYKTEHPNNTRTLAGSKVGAAKTKGTKWFHKLDGSHLRTNESDPRLQEGWIPGRLSPNLKNNINN